MHINKIELPRELKYIEIDCMADLHNGDKSCDFNLVRKRVKEAEDNPSRYLILNGDLINNAVRTGVSDIYSEDLSPMEQLKRCRALFGSVSHKILSVTTGNHELRTYKNDGIDVTYLMCSELGIADKYSMDACMNFIRLGEGTRHSTDKKTNKPRQIAYTIYHTHGTGGGKRVGGKANRVEDMAGIIDADIYVHSHTHLPLAYKKNYYRVDTRSQTISEVTKLFVNTSATLKYGGYGQRGGFSPACTDNPLILLDGTKKEMKALV